MCFQSVHVVGNYYRKYGRILKSVLAVLLHTGLILEVTIKLFKLLSLLIALTHMCVWCIYVCVFAFLFVFVLWVGGWGWGWS